MKIVRVGILATQGYKCLHIQ